LVSTRPRSFSEVRTSSEATKKSKKGLWALPNPIEPWKYEQFLADEAARKAAQLKVMEEEAARQSAETIAKAAEEKAQAVSCLLNSLGGEERLKNLRRAQGDCTGNYALKMTFSM